jgi:biopolymer transport protein ExbD
MAFHLAHDSHRRQPQAEINMIPMIDVMLVLLIVFIIAAPLLTHAVKVDLPKASSEPIAQKPETIQLAIKENGDLFWNSEPVGREALGERIRTAAAQPTPPALHIHADAHTPYETVARTMALAARLGLTRIGFVSTPDTP